MANDLLMNNIVFLFHRSDIANKPLPTNRVGTMGLKRNIFDHGLWMFHCDVTDSNGVISVTLQGNDNIMLGNITRALNSEAFVLMLTTSRYDRFLTTYQPFDILEQKISTNPGNHTLTITVDMSHCKKKYKIHNCGFDLERIAQRYLECMANETEDHFDPDIAVTADVSIIRRDMQKYTHEEIERLKKKYGLLPTDIID